MKIALKIEGNTPPLLQLEHVRARIKVIAKKIRSLKKTAINTILLAKQARECLRRFSAVAGQVHGFTRQLSRCSNKIFSRISRLVLEVSVLQHIKVKPEMSHANRVLRTLTTRCVTADARHTQRCVKNEWIELGCDLHHDYHLLQAAVDFVRRSPNETKYCGESAAELKRAVGEFNVIPQQYMTSIRQLSVNRSVK